MKQLRRNQYEVLSLVVCTVYPSRTYVERPLLLRPRLLCLRMFVFSCFLLNQELSVTGKSFWDVSRDRWFPVLSLFWKCSRSCV